MPNSANPNHIRSSKKQSNACAASVAVLLSVLLLCGCEGVQSALDPRGPHAAAIAAIGWWMFAGAGAILLLVMVLALAAFFRSPERRENMWPNARPNAIILAGGVALPVITLTALLAYGVVAMADLRTLQEDAIDIEVVGNRWWWDVHYLGEDGEVISTANEIRVPVGRPVLLSLRTNDVIHSFWVPALAGKMDLIPGRTNRLIVQADQPGVYRGQCAEFCGAQHARMGLHVIAQSPADFAAWLDRQRMPAAVPQQEEIQRGRTAFMTHCIECHTVRGTGTARLPGPDLTHLASREFIGAGILSNNRNNLASFIARTQEIKPDSAMPSQTQLDRATLDALVHYLESLR